MRTKVLLLLALLMVLPMQPSEAARRKKKKSSLSQTVAKPASNTTIADTQAALAKGDVNNALKAWRAVFKSAPNAAVTHALWLQVAALCLENNRLDDLQNVAREADSFKAAPELRASARLILWRAAQHQERKEEARKLEESLDFVRDWQVIGPFQGQSAGSDTAFAPERENLADKTINNQDRLLRWRVLPKSNDGSCLVGRFLGDAESEGPAVFYVATALNTTQPRTVQLRLNHSGALKMWLNGKLIFIDARQRPTQNLNPDGFVVKQKLEAGWNFLLLKIAVNEPQEALFSLRLTSAYGGDLPKVQTDSSRFIWQAFNGQAAPAIPHLLESLGTPRNAYETALLNFAQGLWGETNRATQRAFWLWPSQSELQQKAAQLAKENKNKEAIAAYQELLQSEEFLPGAWRRLAALQKAAGDKDGALASLRKLRALRPQEAAIAAEFADLLSERGDQNGALGVYQQALTLDPSLIFLREKVRRAKGEKSLLDLIPIAPVPPLPTDNQLPSAEATVWLDEARQIVYDDGATLAHFRQVIQIHSAAAARRFANYALAVPTPTGRLTVESARVISSGKTQDIVTNHRQTVLQIPSLKIGDVLVISYRLEDSRKGILARQFWTQWFFNLAGARVQESRFVLVTPAPMAFDIRSHGSVPAPQRREIKTGSALWHVREWRLENLAPRPVESLMPAAPDSALWIDISSVPDWKTVAGWYREVTAPYSAPDSFIRAKAISLTQKARTPEDKLRALHAYVALDLETANKAPASAWLQMDAGQMVMRDGYGNEASKAALLMALCQAAGIKAQLALFNRRSEGITSFLPAPRFKKMMIVAPTDNGALWLDATHFSADYLPAENQGVAALLLNEAVLFTTPVLPPETNIGAAVHQAQLEASGALKGEVQTTLSGEWGDALRAQFQGLTLSHRTQLIKQIAGQMMTAQLTNGALHNLDDFAQPLKLQVAYASENYALSENETMTLRLPWQKLMNIPQSMTDETNGQSRRAQEWEVAALRGLSLDTVKLQLPLNFAPAALPEEVKDTSPFGRYRFTYKIEGEAATGLWLITTREVLLTPMRVSLDDAAAYGSFCQSIARESKRDIVLKK